MQDSRISVPQGLDVALNLLMEQLGRESVESRHELEAAMSEGRVVDLSGITALNPERVTELVQASLGVHQALIAMNG